tara:strand:+ start:3874 stop:5031 length:1158 start_codon:yes stop_codon:yes gene_type:complete
MATRNRYAEIMAQYAQSQPFSFTSMPSGGFNPYASDYTGGFTPYQRPVPAPSLPVEQDQYAEIIRQLGGGGRGMPADEGGTFTEPTSEQAYNVSTLGRNLRYVSPLFGGLASMYGNYLASQVNPNYSNEGRNYPAPVGDTTTPPTPSADAGGLLGLAPPTVDQYSAYLAQQQTDAAGRPYSTGNGVVPGDMSMNQLAAQYAAYGAGQPSAIAQAQAQADAQAQASRDAIARADAQAQAQAAAEANARIAQQEAQSQARAQAQANAAAAAAAQAAAQNYSNEGRNYGGGGGGGEGGGGGVATGGNNGDASGGGDRGTRGGFAQGGHVSMMHLQGPNPAGPDDGYAALKDGEFVINDKAVKKYGIELMNAINSGKISKGKLRGLLEM